MTSARGNLDAGVVTVGWDDWAAPGMGQLNTCDSLDSSTAFLAAEKPFPTNGGWGSPFVNWTSSAEVRRMIA